MAVYTTRSYASYAAWYWNLEGCDGISFHLGLGRLEMCTVLWWGNIFVNEHSQDLRGVGKITLTNSVGKPIRHVSCNGVNI
jgi:hypothetical protein